MTITNLTKSLILLKLKKNTCIYLINWMVNPQSLILWANLHCNTFYPLYPYLSCKSLSFANIKLRETTKLRLSDTQVLMELNRTSHGDYRSNHHKNRQTLIGRLFVDSSFTTLSAFPRSKRTGWIVKVCFTNQQLIIFQGMEWHDWISWSSQTYDIYGW